MKPIAFNRSWNYPDMGISAAVAIAFYPVFRRLATLGWVNADHTHAYFLVPIFLWLVYRKRAVLHRVEAVSLPGALLFLAGALLYIFSRINDFMFLQATSFVWVIWAIFLLRYTLPSVKQMLFPLSYLMFIVPPPFLVIDTVTMPLKTIATAGSYFLLKTAQLPVSLHGAILRVGNYDFFVADACSGYRSMVTLLALGALYAYLQNTTPAKKWLIFMSVVPLGIAGNIFRIFLTGCLGHYVGIQFAEGFFHEFSGAVVFLIAIFGLVAVTNRVTRSSGR